MTGPAGSWGAGKGLSQRGELQLRTGEAPSSKALAGPWVNLRWQVQVFKMARSRCLLDSTLGSQLMGVELGLSRASGPLCVGDLGCCGPGYALADGPCFGPALFLTLAPTWEGLEGPSHHPRSPSAVPFPCRLAAASPA